MARTRLTAVAVPFSSFVSAGLWDTWKRYRIPFVYTQRRSHPGCAKRRTAHIPLPFAASLFHDMDGRSIPGTAPRSNSGDYGRFVCSSTGTHLGAHDRTCCQANGAAGEDGAA